jgi:hypothetical protein
MLAGLERDHLGRSCFYYLDVPLEETLRRHATRPQAAEFGAAEMRDWYRPRDLLASVREHIIPAVSTLPETVDRMLADTPLLRAAGRDTACRPDPGDLARGGRRQPAAVPGGRGRPHRRGRAGVTGQPGYQSEATPQPG